MSRALAAIVAAALALPLAPSALAACPRTTLGDVEDEVMCPVCGTPLELATEAPQAVRERELIQRLIDDCRSKEEVKAALAAEFGDSVWAVPEDEGFDLAASLVPGVAILFGAAGVAFAVVRWRRRAAPAPEAGPAEGSTAARLDADLERYEL